MGRDREGVENKTFYVSSRDVSIVCPRLYGMFAVLLALNFKLFSLRPAVVILSVAPDTMKL
jgi:hypothetical protein